MLHQKKVPIKSKRKLQVDAANGTHDLGDPVSKKKVQVELGTKS